MRSLTGSKRLLDIMKQHQPEAQDIATVFPITLSSILAEKGEDALYNFLSDVLHSSTSQQSPWAIRNKKASDVACPHWLTWTTGIRGCGGVLWECQHCP